MNTPTDSPVPSSDAYAPARIAALVEAGAVRVPEITAYALAEAADAHRVSQGRHLRGKLVLKVR